MPPATAPKLKIKDVADRTGVAAATIRMWEQRYGFPAPQRTASGYRLYDDRDIEAIRTVVAFRRRGLSVPAAIDRARHEPDVTPATHPSIYAAVTAVDVAAHPRVLRRSTLVAMSQAIEDEVLARGASGIVVGAFQRRAFYDHVAHRYEQLALRSEATIAFADFPAVVDHGVGAPIEVPIAPTDALGNEWAVVVDAPSFAACLLAWERPDRDPAAGRQFEAVLSFDSRAVRRAVRVAAALAGRQSPELADRLGRLVEARPLTAEQPASALASLTTRMAAYLDELR